jgi:hypothetical protein
MRPGVSPVAAAKDSVDFHSGPDHTMIVGVDDKTGHEGLADRTFPSRVDCQLLPVLSEISRAIDPSRARAGKENIGIDRVDGQRPDCRQNSIRVDALPLRPAIAAHEQACIATCENGMRLRGMGGQRLYTAVERKRSAMPRPRLSGIRTVPYAPANRSKTYAVVRCHRRPPSSRCDQAKYNLSCFGSCKVPCDKWIWY